MGQCNSTAVECCRDPSGRPGHCQEILWQGAPPRPSTTGRITVPVPNNPKNTLQVSVSLDQQSEHSSVCIRVELHDGQSLLMDTTFHSTNTPRVENTSSSRSSSVVAETVPSLLTTPIIKTEPNKNHYKDIHFTANETKQEEEQEQAPAVTLPPAVAPAAADMSLRDFLEQPRKATSRRSAFRQQQQEPQVVRFASSDGALLRNTPVKKENSWYNLGYNSGMESAQSLDLANATTMQSKNSSGHSTKNSWGGISVQKSMRCVVKPAPTATANKDSQGKAQFPPIDISMNDISGNTLPTRYDYQDDVSVTEDDDEMDHLWEYHRSVKALTTSTTSSVVDDNVAPTTDNAAMMRRPSTDSGESALSSTASSSAWLGSPPSFISNVSGVPQGKKSYVSRHHRHSSLILQDSKSKILGNGHNSNRSCQSDSYMVVRRRTMSEGSSSSKPAAARTPWNPLQFPAF